MGTVCPPSTFTCLMLQCACTSLPVVPFIGCEQDCVPPLSLHHECSGQVPIHRSRHEGPNGGQYCFPMMVCNSAIKSDSLGMSLSLLSLFLSCPSLCAGLQQAVAFAHHRNLQEMFTGQVITDFSPDACVLRVRRTNLVQDALVQLLQQNPRNYKKPLQACL